MPEVAAVGLLVLVAIIAVVLIRQRSSGPSGILTEQPTAPEAPFASTEEWQPGMDPVDDWQPPTVEEGPNASLDEALSALLADPANVEFVILEGMRGYVQFAVNDAGLYGEAVSNAFLDADARLSPEEEGRVAEIGWSQSSSEQNFSRIWPHPVDVSAVADVAQQTLSVYGDDFDSAGIKTA